MMLIYHYRNDEQSSKSVYNVQLLTVILNVLTVLSSGLAYDDSRWNDIENVTNTSKSGFDRIDANMINDEKIGLFIFTQYCGPGERVWRSVSDSGDVKFPSTNTYADIDVCCKQHDECPNYISGDSDYDRYMGLTRRPQIFSRF